MADAAEPVKSIEVPKVTPKQELDKLKNTDGITLDKLQDQLGGGVKRYVDPVTGFNKEGVKLNVADPEKRQEVELRIVQSGYIDFGKSHGFDKRVDPITGEALRLNTPEGFQRWYQLSRNFIASESLKMISALSAEGKFIPDQDPITGQSFEDNSLKLFWVLKNQTGNNYLSETEQQDWAASFKQLTDQYPSLVNMPAVMDIFDNEFYKQPFKNLLNRSLLVQKAGIIAGVNTLLRHSRVSIPESINRKRLTPDERLHLIPAYVEKAIQVIESQGVHIPVRNPDDPNAPEYPRGSIERYLLAIEIAKGNRPDVLKKRDEALAKEQEEKQKKVAHQKEQIQLQREANRKANIEAGSQKKDSLTKVSWKARLTEGIKDVFNVDGVKILFKRAEGSLDAIYHSIKGDSKESYKKAVEKQKAIISQYGLDPNEVLSIWKKSAEDYFAYKETIIRMDDISPLFKYIHAFEELATFGRSLILGNTEGGFITKNIVKLQSLERKRPGIAKALFKEFGVANYSRYPIEMLVDQYDHMYDQDRPYGIIAYPFTDWNGGFATDQKILANFAKGAKGKAYVRIIEAGSKIDLAKRLINLHNSYEPLISFGIIGGHGTPGSINFGGEDPVHKLYISDFINPTDSDQARLGAASIASFFEKGADVVLISCSTGQEGGIAEIINKVTGLTVKGPTIPTAAKSIKLVRENGRFNINVKYPSKNIGRVYRTPKTTTSAELPLAA